MGVLLGDWVPVNPATPDRMMAVVFSIVALRRLDKRPDRVEISPEQLHKAFVQAESTEKQYHHTTRVIGWYHSHPHITVFPSQVDLRTQLSQQQLDACFFGLIVSCFDELANCMQKMRVTCFQTTYGDEGIVQREVPFYVESTPMHDQMRITLSNRLVSTALAQLPRELCDEQITAYESSCQQITGNDVGSMQTRTRNANLFTLALSGINEKLTSPTNDVLQHELDRQNAKIRELTRMRDELVSRKSIDLIQLGD
jgi:BRCA1/BRCA2-containing complex subunit 3